MPRINNDLKPFAGDARLFPWYANAGELSVDEYYADSRRLSHSMIRAGYYNPEILALQFAGWTRPSDSDAMGEGRRFHMALLQPDLYNTLILVVDDGSICAEIGGAKPRGTNKYKEWRDAVEKEALRSNQTIISIDEHQLHQAMVDRTLAVPHIKALLDNTMREQVIIGTHGNVSTKGLIDCTDGSSYILDVKRVHLPKFLRGFTYDRLSEYINLMDYDSQLYHYGKLMNIETRYILFIPDEYPHTPCLVTLTPETITRGKYKFDQMFHEVRSAFNMDTMTLHDSPFSVNMMV
jgi:hypothetical protein